jgi:DNA-binding transcriptional ArsR family regulator
MKSKQAELFKVLGVESRIRIIGLLKEKGPLGVNEMSQILGITPSAVSQHLKILKHGGLVRNERKGYWIPYEVDPVALEECRDLLSEVCTCGCEGTCRIREVELKGAKDKVALLRKYERELQRELKKVQAQIRELKKEA